MGPLSVIQTYEETIYKVAIVVVLSYSVFGWLTLTGIKLNYGRLANSFVNVYLNPKLAWFLFEIPNLLWAAYFLFYKNEPLSFGFALFIIHYLNRDILYPLTLKTTTKVPLEIVLNAFIFTLANGFLQGNANLTNLMTANPERIALGTVIFFIGMIINVYSDKILQEAKEKAEKDAKQQESLEKSGKKKYAKIDRFLFKYIANPNYLGEIIQWAGYAIVCGHLQSILFVLSTINVLTPAAMIRSKWNHQNIPNYPKQRKAIFPFVL